MSTFDDFEDDVKAEGGYRKRGCAVGTMLSTLPETDAQRVNSVLKNQSLTGTAIAQALKKRMDDPPSGYTIQRHRRGICSCDTD